MRANALAVMAKAPVAGEVKTRLVPPLSAGEAARLYGALLSDLLHSLRAFPAADRFVVFTPPDAATLFDAIVPAGFACFPQHAGDLGKRMEAVFADLFSRRYRQVVVIGSDVPVFPAGFLAKAFETLDESRGCVVLGPSEDGGYYLIGMSRLVREIFSDIPWGQDSVLSTTLARLSALACEVRLLPPWFDLDRVEDLGRLFSAGEKALALSQPRTLRVLRQLPARVKYYLGPGSRREPV